MGTEIRTFYSLKEISDYVTDQINQYKVISEDYSQWLGSLLRDYQETHGNEDWFQNLTALQKGGKARPSSAKTKKSQKKKGKGKAKKTPESSWWVHFNELLLCATEQGEAEILFEAVEKINKKLESLEKIKAALERLEHVGLGEKVSYIAFIKEDVPEKLVLRSKTDAQFDEKFQFIADFSVSGLRQQREES